VLFWVLIALLTAAAILAVLIPLGRAPVADDAAAHARRVYRDQLAELERDKADGRINAAEAEAARAEIARRLIAVESDASKSAPHTGGVGARRVAALVGLIGVPLLSLSIYLGLGAPQLPGAPLAARLEAPASPDDIEALIAKVEEHLAAQPEDGRGWEVIAPVYLRLGRADDAVRAFQNAIRLLGSTAARQTSLGEAILVAENGIVTEDARKAFAAANQLDPAAPGPRFFLALAAEQEGKFSEAAEAWSALLAEAPADAPWRPMVETALARVSPGDDVAPGPTGEDVAAAQDMTAEEQTAMIEGMVSGLAERLESEPNDVEGWLRLIRSYVVLGRATDAADAARAALAGVADPAARERVEALIAELGVAAETATP
jgi:cytochrome c-type biogenesis protein CcmH